MIQSNLFLLPFLRCSFYRSKQVEPPEEEESAAAPAAWEHVDLEDGQGKQGGGGMDSDAPRKVAVVSTIAIVIYGILAGCFYLTVAYIYPDAALAGYLVFFGAMSLAMAAISLCGLAARGYSWWTSAVSH